MKRYAVKPPMIIRRLYSRLIWNFPTTEKILYLTFDDGPIPEVTPFVLDELKKYNAKGTFFCTGVNVKRYPEIFERIKSEGHAAGNHTYNHLNGWKTNNKKYFEDIEAANELLNTRLFRPPYGRIKRAQISYVSEKYSIIMWDVLSFDFDKNTTPQKCLSNVISNSAPGSIIVFHDSLKAKKNIFYALPNMLNHFASLDYKFRAIQNL